ncbi:HpsJ-like protein, cyanoexosortase A-associated [Leptolyngbya ohadii]|uniref:HpsJ-like protein, cyanoexosortase A-associated n=1 Tax=Leptolyngbya ohadii TaxID=1962290 RepID=UPI000B59B6F1|nr:HpsJ family protein [Leptolyngbya ohadii]
MTLSPDYSSASESQPIGNEGNTNVGTNAATNTVIQTDTLMGANADVQAEENKTASGNLQRQKTMMLSRRTGYALLLLCFIDLLYILVPPELLNPVWEYQTIGDLVKLVPVPLLSLMLIFYGDTALRSKPERFALKILSWLTLFVGIVFLLLVPLTISDAVRIHQFNNNQINNQVSQQRLQLDATRKQLEKASPEALRNLVPLPDQNGNLPDIPNSPEQAKTQLLNNVNRAKEEAEQQANQARANLRQNLVKNTAKLVVGLLITGCFFIYVWRMTVWTRRKESYLYESPRQSSLTALPKLFGFGSRSRRRL